jgi:hypothetical protein
MVYIIYLCCYYYTTEVDLDPHRTFCPEAGCETVCHVCSTSTSDAITRPTPVDCPTVSMISKYIICEEFNLRCLSQLVTIRIRCKKMTKMKGLNSGLHCY